MGPLKNDNSKSGKQLLLTKTCSPQRSFFGFVCFFHDDLCSFSLFVFFICFFLFLVFFFLMLLFIHFFFPSDFFFPHLIWVFVIFKKKLK